MFTNCKRFLLFYPFCGREKWQLTIVYAFVLCFYSMTGYSTGELPLSRTTVASLEDIGYEVDYSAADPFPITSLGSSCVCTGLQEEKNGKIVSGIGITSLAQNNIGNRNIDAKDETNTGKVGMAPIEQSKNPHPNNVRERNQRKGTIGQPGKKEHRSKHALATNEGPFGKLYKKKRNKRTGRGKKNKKRGRGGGQNRRKLSEGGRRVAEKYGQMLLQKRKQKKVGLTEKDTVRYIGDRFVSILYIEENVVYSVDVKGQDL